LSVYETNNSETLCSALQMLLLRIAPEHSTAERRLGEHKMSQSVPWGISAVPKRAHYRVKSQPLSKGSSAQGAF